MVASTDSDASLLVRVPAALGFALFAGLAGFALAAFSPAILNDSDTYWHISAGQWMLAHGAVLHADPFSYTAHGARWHTQEWLAEILMALAWRGGWTGVHLLFALAAGAAAAVVAWFVRARMDMVPALLVTVLGLSCVTAGLLARPHMLALPLMALWTAALAAARERDAPPPWWLLLVMPLWANLHGSFAFGLALAGALAVEAVLDAHNRKRTALVWGGFVVAAILSALLTPEGLAGLLFPLRLATMHGIGHIGEWQPSDFSHVSPFEIVLLAAMGTLALGKVRVPLWRLAILLGLVFLALGHARHQMLLGISGTLLLTPSLAKAWPAKPEPVSPLPALAALVLLAMLCVTRAALPAARGDDAVTPAAALAHVPRFVRETPVLNDYAFGGYLIWNGIAPFIDSRADLYGDSFLDNYAAITAPDKDALASTLAFYHVRWTIFRADAPVVKLLDAMPGWHRLYGDNVAVVHTHD